MCSSFMQVWICISQWLFKQLTIACSYLAPKKRFLLKVGVKHQSINQFIFLHCSRVRNPHTPHGSLTSVKLIPNFVTSREIHVLFHCWPWFTKRMLSLLQPMWKFICDLHDSEHIDPWVFICTILNQNNDSWHLFSHLNYWFFIF